MPKSFQQKLKILYLMRVFSEKTDEAHPMSVKDLISYLESLGIHAERKTIYDDIETLRVFGMDIMNRRERPSGFYLASREFETAELKLLVDAVQFSRFLTVGKSRQLIQKLEHFTSIYQAKDLQRQAIVLDQVKNTNESIYYNVDEIHRAISQNRQISFQYTEWTVSKERHLKKGGARYQISPWQMIWQDGNYYLIGVDEKSGIVKHYRVDKMLKILTENEARNGAELFRKFDSARFAAGTFGKPGIIIISPAYATTNPAPLDRRKSLIVILKPSGRPNKVGSSDKEYCVFATQTGKVSPPKAAIACKEVSAFFVNTTSLAP